jgi:hypothetical protein
MMIHLRKNLLLTVLSQVSALLVVVVLFASNDSTTVVEGFSSVKVFSSSSSSSATTSSSIITGGGGEGRPRRQQQQPPSPFSTTTSSSSFSFSSSCLLSESIVDGDGTSGEVEDEIVVVVGNDDEDATTPINTGVGGVTNKNNDSDSSEVEDDLLLVETQNRREGLKRSLLQLGASYDRGFGATPRARREVDDVISQLEELNPETNASFGIDGSASTSTSSTSRKGPLEGNWRMIWTTAVDVLVLGTNPFITVGAIYQIYTPPIATNVIDILPKLQPLVASSNLSSIIRANVETRSSSTLGRPMKIGLVFERVMVQPMELFGTPMMGILPPLAFDLPRLPSSLLGGDGGGDAAGYFDVTYVDSDILIIRQNAVAGVGGLFVLTKVENTDP